MRYTASNYKMGRPVQTVEFDANSPDEARRIAEQKLPGKNGQGQGGKPAAVIGIKAKPQRSR